MAMRYLPEGLRYDTVHVQYKKAAIKGSLISPSISVSENKTAVYLSDEGGDIYVAAEFLT
jgi:hypothetical protein